MQTFVQLLLLTVTTYALGAPLAHPHACAGNTTANDIARDMNLTGRVAIVTGGDSGLGMALVDTLAKQGATVIIAEYNLERAQQAAAATASATGSDVRGALLDLSSFASVRKFAADFSKHFSALHLLVNNAGIGHVQSSLAGGTVDGFEDVFEVDYLGHFLLTELLLPLLRATATQMADHSGVRVVNTASSAHLVACKSVGAPADCFKDWSWIPPPINGSGAIKNNTYGIAKFAQIQHAMELSAREAANGVHAYSVGPGLVYTGMTKESNFTAFCEAMVQFGIHQAKCPYTAQEGAAVLAYTALQAPQESSGSWYTRYTECTTDKAVNQQGFTLDMRTALYDKSRHWVGLA